jgi:hypothetical protein
MKELICFALFLNKAFGVAASEEDASYPDELITAKVIRMGGFILYLIGIQFLKFRHYVRISGNFIGHEELH